MSKSRMKKNIVFLLGILLFCIIVFFGYYLITGKRNPLFGIIDIINEKKEINDNYNGIYTYYDDLNGSKLIFTGCSLSKIANHIMIVNDDYYTFRSSCMGSYLRETGKTNDLKVELDEEKSEYYVIYNNKKYDKDYATTNITLNNNIEEKIETVELSSYQLFMKETQFEGNYYNIENANIAGINSDMKLSIIRNDISNSFDFRILGILESKRISLYTFNVTDFDYLPDMYAYGKNVVLVEREKNENKKLKYMFKVVDSSGLIYDVYDYFPIIIDGVSLNKENSIFITFDKSSRLFRMLVGFDEKMCVDDYNEEEKDDITYYEFTIDYNYSENGFDNPKFVKIGHKSEGCKYVNSVMGR